MNIYCKILFIFGLQLFSVASLAEPFSVNTLSYPELPQTARLAFAVTGSLKHRVFALDNPPRLVIDVKDAVLEQTLKQPPADHPLFAKVRSATKNAHDIRFIVDLKKTIDREHYALSTNNKSARQLLVDLIGKQPPVAAVAENRSAPPETVKSESTDAPAGKSVLSTVAHRKTQRIVVAIDAGHGGNDPGAQGPQGTEEKTVTFAIAQKLAALVNARPDMKAVMVRRGDYYIGLRERMQIARNVKADVFISIHADAVQDASVRGASVYTLSTRGASSEIAHWLANSENAVEVGGVDLSDKENVLASVLLDLSQTATQQASDKFAGSVLKNFQNISVLHKDSVQKAGFIVLKSPDIPSILVETAYISNPLEEQNLTSAHYQAQIAHAILAGIRDYFDRPLTTENRMAAL